MKYYIVHTICDDGGGTIENYINLVTTSQTKAKNQFNLLVNHEKEYLDEQNLHIMEESDAIFVAGDGAYGSAFIEIKLSEYIEE